VIIFLISFSPTLLLTRYDLYASPIMKETVTTDVQLVNNGFTPCFRRMTWMTQSGVW